MAKHLLEDELIALAASGGAIPEHVAECPSCAARLREFQQTLELTNAAPEMEWNRLHAGAFQHRVREAIGHSTDAPGLISWWQPALSGAVVALVAVFAYQSLVGPPDAQSDAHRPASITAAQIDPSQNDARHAARDEMIGTDPLAGEDGLPAGDSEVLDTEALHLTDDELLSAIDAYLLETASDDELFSSIGDLTDDGAVVVLDN